MNKKIKNKKWNILLVIIILIFLFSILFNQVILLNPKGITKERNPEFKWFSRYDSYKLLVDDNKEFSSSILDINLSEKYYKTNIDLEFKEYYWKVLAFDKDKIIESNVQKFNVQSLVALELKDSAKNKGNTKINLTIKKGLLIVGSAILDVDQSLDKEIEKNATYIAEQNE